MNQYCIGFDDQIRHVAVGNLTLSLANCTVTALTSIENLKTPSLREVFRLQVTATGTNPTVGFVLSPLPVQEKRRMVGLLGCRVISGFAMTISESTAGALLQLTTKPQSVSARTAGALVLNSPATMSGTSIIEIGRYWLSDLCKIDGGPFGEWEDGGEDSGTFVETPLFGGNLAAGAFRKVARIPIDYMEEFDCYTGEPASGFTEGFAAFAEAREFFGTSDYIIAGDFTPLDTGGARYWASSKEIGARKLIHGRMTSVPSIRRIEGSIFATALEIAELL
jgi:hypothetical protein